MNFKKKFNRHSSVITLCCICFFLLGLSGVDSDFKAAMDFYNKKDFSKAFKSFQALADKKYAKAERMLGMMYLRGEETAKEDKQAFEWISKAAQQDDAIAQHMLGYLYDNGIGVSQNKNQADYWYQKGRQPFEKDAKNGDSYAQWILGWCYKAGAGVPHDDKQAFYWYKKAAEQGHAGAQDSLGDMYTWGQGVPKDDNQAFYWYKKAAEQGHAGAQDFLGFMYESGEGVSQDYKQALYWYKKAAEQGNASAQHSLGGMYESGEGVSQDYKQALYWYKKAAEQGHAGAQESLGTMYEDGKGIPKDYKQAIYWYKKALRNDYSLVQEDLARIYEKMKDYKKAFYWHKKCAELELMDSEYRVAEMYEEGKGVPRDYKQAMYWYKKAGTFNNIGLLYEAGKGVPPDYTQAVDWFQKSADSGNAYGQYNLGRMYMAGKGITQNYQYSYVWFNLAAAQGHEYAIINRDAVVLMLSPQQIASAQEMSLKIKNKMDADAQESIERIKKIMQPKKDNKTNDQTTDRFVVTLVKEPKVKLTGTGFLITNDGHVLTCLHVVKNAVAIKVEVGGKIQPATLIRTDPNNDLALLKIEGDFAPLAFSPDRTARMGQEVFTIGFPNPGLQGVNAKLTKGDISSLTGVGDDVRLYQVSVPIQAGNSGGPLLDENGNICGVIVAVLDAATAFKISGTLPQNVNYAVKSAYAQALLDTLPEVAEKLPKPAGTSPFSSRPSFEDVVKRVGKSIVMVLAYE